MRKLFVRSAVCGVFLLAIGSVATASAQQEPWRVVQGGDGTLYLVTNGTRFVLNPDQISDDELATLTDSGTLGGQLPMPPTKAPVPATSTPVPPTAIPAPVAEQPTKISGSNELSTKPFLLRGGNYSIAWSITSTRASGGGVWGGFLTAVDPASTFSESFGGLDGKTSNGETQTYNVPSGLYYLRIISTETNWSVTITPQ